MLKKEIEIIELMTICYNYAIDPTNKENIKKLQDTKNKIRVVEYCPLREKNAGLRYISSTANISSHSMEDIAIDIELLISLSVLHLYTNIRVNNEINTDIFNSELYDALMMSNVLDEIEKVAEADIKRYRQMCYDSMNWSKFLDLMDIVGSVDNNNLDKLINTVEETKALINDETKDMLKRLTNINYAEEDSVSRILTSITLNSLEKQKDNKISNYVLKNNQHGNLYNIISELSVDTILEDMEQYIEQNKLEIKINKEEVEDAYEFLKNKYDKEYNEINVKINEVEKETLKHGMSLQMIKLIQEKQNIENTYKQKEELLRLADTMTKVNPQNIDEIDKYLKSISNDNNK